MKSRLCVSDQLVSSVEGTGLQNTEDSKKSSVPSGHTCIVELRAQQNAHPRARTSGRTETRTASSLGAESHHLEIAAPCRPSQLPHHAPDGPWPDRGEQRRGELNQPPQVARDEGPWGKGAQAQAADQRARLPPHPPAARPRSANAGAAVGPARLRTGDVAPPASIPLPSPRPATPSRLRGEPFGAVAAMLNPYREASGGDGVDDGRIGSWRSEAAAALARSGLET